MMKTPKDGKQKKAGGKKKRVADIFSARLPQTKRNLEGSYPTGDASPNKKESPIDDMKEYTSRRPLVESSMVQEATETTRKRADVFVKPKPTPRQQVCQAITMMGSEAAYVKSLQVNSEAEANLRIMEIAEATGKMLKKSHQNRPGKVEYECNENCPCKISFNKNSDDPNAAWKHSFTPHLEYCNGAVSKQKNLTMESTPLAPTLYDSLRVNSQLHWELARNTSSPYLLSVPT